MTKAEFLLTLAGEIKAKDRNTEVALLVKPDLTILGIGKHTGAASNTYNTAIVNVLSNSAGDDISDCLCVTTYEPTPMCKGMKETLKVKPAFVQTGAVAISGMMTTYGIDLVETFFHEM